MRKTAGHRDVWGFGVKGIGKIHVSRKIVLVFGGILVLCGTTGAAAAYIGADKLLGPSYAQLNGLACTEVKTVTIKKKDRFWVRKYITTPETEDGLARVKTALRVASVIHDNLKPDLIQVVVLDAKGAKSVPDMRGRAVGADVLFVSDPSRLPENAGGQMFTARYIDKKANEIGRFYGEKINLTEDDIGQLVSRLNDRTDCTKPEVDIPEAGGEASASAGHGETKPANGEGAEQKEAKPSGHGEASQSGEAVPAEDSAATAPAEGKGETEDAGGKSKGWLASITGMILGGEKEEGAAVPTSAEDAPGLAAEGEVGHGEPVATEPVAAEDVGKGEAKPLAAEMPQDTTAGKSSGARGAEASAPAHEVASAQAVAETQKGWLGSVSGMIFGEKEAKPLPFGGAGQKVAPAAQASVPARPEEPMAEDGSPGEQADAPAAKPEEAKKTEAAVTDQGDGEMSSEADAAGAAWLAKLRAAPVKAAAAPAEAVSAEREPAADTAKAHDEQPAAVVPAEDSLVLPPKAGDSKDARQKAEASQ
ncbi:MAG: hypothetical protein DI528_03085 [Shinella sp.]|nr:MAG: hypothetical protein DI528_03085 [Shinella sp.]